MKKNKIKISQEEISNLNNKVDFLIKKIDKIESLLSNKDNNISLQKKENSIEKESKSAIVKNSDEERELGQTVIHINKTYKSDGTYYIDQKDKFFSFYMNTYYKEATSGFFYKEEVIFPELIYKIIEKKHKFFVNFEDEEIKWKFIQISNKNILKHYKNKDFMAKLGDTHSDEIDKSLKNLSKNTKLKFVYYSDEENTYAFRKEKRYKLLEYIKSLKDKGDIII